MKISQKGFIAPLLLALIALLLIGGGAYAYVQSTQSSEHTVATSTTETTTTVSPSDQSATNVTITSTGASSTQLIETKTVKVAAPTALTTSTAQAVNWETYAFPKTQTAPITQSSEDYAALLDESLFKLEHGTGSIEEIVANGTRRTGWQLLSSSKPGAQIETNVGLPDSAYALSFKASFASTQDKTVALSVESDGNLLGIYPAYANISPDSYATFILSVPHGIATTLDFKFIGNSESKVSITDIKILRRAASLDMFPLATEATVNGYSIYDAQSPTTLYGGALPVGSSLKINVTRNDGYGGESGAIVEGNGRWSTNFTNGFPAGTYKITVSNSESTVLATGTLLAK